MINFEELKALPKEELVRIAAIYNVPASIEAESDLIAKAIIEKLTQPEPMRHVAEKPTSPVHNNTPDQVREAIAPYIAKEGFNAEFSEQENTWTFTCKGASDSGNLSIPLRVIKQRAESVSRGRRAPMSFGKDGTYGTSYADNILMG